MQISYTCTLNNELPEFSFPQSSQERIPDTRAGTIHNTHEVFLFKTHNNDSIKEIKLYSSKMI